MAHVIPFRCTARGDRSAPPAGASAEIVIFPGVRYEYHSEPAATAEPRGKRKSAKARDRLDLVD